MSYNKDTDYQAKIAEAAGAGDYKKAAEYEQSRNEKIDGENLNYQKTNNYAGWIEKTDYAADIQKQISNGAGRSDIADNLRKRVEKASNTIGMEKYAYDDTYNAAIKYIMGSGGFSYEKKAPKYQNKYDGYTEKLLRNLTNKKSFSYDPYDDDLYKYYRDEYTRAGSRAMEDSLGKLAANTGGVASSYAANAASQAYDYYNTKLTQIIPELYEMRYNEYLDDVENDYNSLNALMKLSDAQYDRYLGELSAYQRDRDFSYNVYSDMLAREDKLLENNRDYELSLKKFNEEAAQNSFERGQQEYENMLDEKRYNEKMALEKEQYKQKMALEKWDTLGYLDYASADILGLPYGTKTSDYDYKQAQKYKIFKK